MDKALGVVGHPIQHSLSPVMHLAALDELGLKLSYERFDVLPEELDGFMREAEEKFLGLNITIPHKIEIMKFLDSLDKSSEQIGAVNTVKFNKEIKGYNTDGVGALKALKESGVDVNGKEILILGAGGAARAIVFSLLDEGASVTIANIVMEMAESLAKDTGGRVEIIHFSDEEIGERLEKSDILINATSVGMYPEMEKSPVSKEVLNPKLVVMDIVYNPIETKLLREAKELGCKTVNGVGMLVHQGAESLRIWLDVKAPVEVMRNAILRELRNL